MKQQNTHTVPFATSELHVLARALANYEPEEGGYDAIAKQWIVERILRFIEEERTARKNLTSRFAAEGNAS